MSIESAPYFWVICDDCGERDEYGEVWAWAESDQAELVWTDSQNHVKDGKHYCEGCLVWCPECDDELTVKDTVCDGCKPITEVVPSE